MSNQRKKNDNMQNVFYVCDCYDELDDYILSKGFRKILLVCSNSIKNLSIWKYFLTLKDRVGIEVVVFHDFTPNPKYEEVVDGVKVFNENICDTIVAVGGGSAIDVAKCIKLFSNMDSKGNYLKQQISPNGIKLIAIPTTAGTGSESTRYAVIYYNGEKQSVTHDSCIPSAVVFNPYFLFSLPDYQKKATMLDALCHATESFWSVNSTKESIEFATQAITIILANYKGYFINEIQACKQMLMAANLAGKAINITQTTAGHAMSYKLTSLYGIAHGHAVDFSGFSNSTLM